MSAKVPKINVTKNYALFGRSDENRALCPQKHKALIDAMKDYGFLPEFPIVVERDKQKHLIVKDGQHRLAAAETLGLPVYWVEASTDWDVARVNSAVQKWVTVDYAERFARQGHKDYQEALDFMREHRLPMCLSFAILAGAHSWSSVSGAFYSGDYKIKDRDLAEKVATIYRTATGLNPKVRNARFVEAVMSVSCVKGFDPKRLTRGMEMAREKLVGYATKDSCLDMLEAIYNYHQRSLFPLKNEATMAARSRKSHKKADSNGAAE